MKQKELFPHIQNVLVKNARMFSRYNFAYVSTSNKNVIFINFFTTINAIYTIHKILMQII